MCDTLPIFFKQLTKGETKMCEEYKQYLEEQKQLDNIFNFPKVTQEFHVTSITVNTQDELTYFGKKASIARFISRLMAFRSTIEADRVNDIISIEPLTTPHGLMTIKTRESDSKDSKSFETIRKALLILENSEFCQCLYYLNIEITPIIMTTTALPFWCADFYRRLLVGVDLFDEIKENQMGLIPSLNSYIFLHGDRIRFAALFKTMFGVDAHPILAISKRMKYYDHVFTYLKGRFYDARGSYDYNEITKDWILTDQLDTTMDEAYSANSVFHYSHNADCEALNSIITKFY